VGNIIEPLIEIGFTLMIGAPIVYIAILLILKRFRRNKRHS